MRKPNANTGAPTTIETSSRGLNPSAMAATGRRSRLARNATSLPDRTEVGGKAGIRHGT
jgi:hypothetical protein